MITIEQMIQREVLCCMSSLVSTLASGYGDLGDLNQSLRDTCEQAYELAAPVLDYEEAAIQGGWHKSGNRWTRLPQNDEPRDDGFYWFDTAEMACSVDSLDPYEWEVYEHWAITQWFAERLIAQGERVDTDFAGLNIWARTTTGQAITADNVVQKIYKDMMNPSSFDLAPGQ